MSRNPVPQRKYRILSKLVALSSGIAIGLSTGGGALASNGKFFPIKVVDASSGTPKEVEYDALKSADKPYNLCVLFPHLKDSSWVGVAYGIAKQAEAMNVSMNLYEAGGYDNLPKQISQFDDCMASGADAIIVGAISGAGLSKKFAEAKAKGVQVVGVINPLDAGAAPAAIFADFAAMGGIGAESLKKYLKPGDTANVVTFPGPAGSGWAEAYNDGFKAAAANTNIKVLSEKFGDTGVGVQLQLVQDALQAYPDLNVIWGTAPTIEAAAGAVAEAGRTDIKMLASYSNQAMFDALQRGDVLGFPTELNAAQGAISVDLAVRLLEKKPVMSLIHPQALMIDQDQSRPFPWI
jgi:protein TorT